jgi:hypothetical protein
MKAEQTFTTKAGSTRRFCRVRSAHRSVHSSELNGNPGFCYLHRWGEALSLLFPATGEMSEGIFRHFLFGCGVAALGFAS